MLAWIWRVSEQVQQLANQDPEYQKFTAQRAELDQAFTGLLDRLSEVAGNQQYRFAQLAWRYGTGHR